jgi:LPXTG-motif cell wall-anchored protein
MMKKIVMSFSVLIALAGLVWFGQGIGIIHGSVMTDDSKWAVIGGILVIVGAVGFWFAKKQK